MLDYSQAKLFIDGIQWPEGTRPLLAMGTEGERALVKLYDAKQRRVITARGPSHEGALRVAVELWVGDLGPKPFALPEPVREALRAQARRLTN